jgi:hypothetical protein
LSVGEPLHVSLAARESAAKSPLIDPAAAAIANALVTRIFRFVCGCLPSLALLCAFVCISILRQKLICPNRLQPHSARRSQRMSGRLVEMIQMSTGICARLEMVTEIIRRRIMRWRGYCAGRPCPSPGTPGRGWGEGDLELRWSLVLEITLTPALSRSTGRGSQFTARLSIIRAKRNRLSML